VKKLTKIIDVEKLRRMLPESYSDDDIEALYVFFEQSTLEELFLAKTYIEQIRGMERQ
jgi:hypothetical protein